MRMHLLEAAASSRNVFTEREKCVQLPQLNGISLCIIENYTNHNFATVRKSQREFFKGRVSETTSMLMFLILKYLKNKKQRHTQLIYLLVDENRKDYLYLKTDISMKSIEKRLRENYLKAKVTILKKKPMLKIGSTQVEP